MKYRLSFKIDGGPTSRQPQAIYFGAIFLFEQLKSPEMDSEAVYSEKTRGIGKDESNQ